MPTAIEKRFLRVRGRRTRVLHTAGDGAAAPIVLVHGLGLSANVFLPHMPALAKEAASVVAPDLPGFGRSRGPLTGMSVRGVAEWLCELHTELALPPAVWIGHSVAAQAIVRLAAAAPERAAALVLATPTGERDVLGWIRQLAGLARTAFREPAWLVGDVVRHYLRTLPSRTVGTWLRARWHDPVADAAGIRCPTLIVLGAEDPVVPLAFARRLREALPDADLKTVSGAAHGAALSHPAELVAEVRAFLSATRFATPP